ncbi:Uncharacterised protein [Mycobacterium tuberculosis]|uniref:Uncharacterized protein n=1 Tax=Mycobacterium tuberculosis TaxID=1773 RepID=A0A655JTA6_MYCTX|nr:Uncharacterised protein [Mycobacterium tuberculosis]
MGGSTTGASGVHEFPTEPGAAGLDGEPGRSVAFGSRVSTLVFSRFTSLIRSCRRLPSVTACTVLLTSASSSCASAHWPWAIICSTFARLALADSTI